MHTKPLAPGSISLGGIRKSYKLGHLIPNKTRQHDNITLFFK